MNKYSARRTYSHLCERWFASKAEARRGEELRLLARAGEISDLRYQVRFILSKDPKVTITIDFCYLEGNKLHETRIFEDVKGVETREFRVKRIWLEQSQGIKVLLSK